MNNSPVTIESPEDIAEDFKSALSSFERSIEKVRPLFEHLATELDNSGVVLQLHGSKLEISIKCFHRDYYLSYQVEGQSVTVNGTLFLQEETGGQKIDRATARIADNKFIGFLTPKNNYVPFNKSGLVAIVQYWLSQPLPNLKAPTNTDYSALVD